MNQEQQPIKDGPAVLVGRAPQPAGQRSRRLRPRDSQANPVERPPAAALVSGAPAASVTRMITLESDVAGMRLSVSFNADLVDAAHAEALIKAAAELMNQQVSR